MKAWLLAGCFLGALLCACNEQQPPAQPGSFDRPTRVAFVCFNLDVPPTKPKDRAKFDSILDLDTCNRENPDIYMKGHKFALHALVLQSSRGEVAAVDLVNNRTLDSRRDIPGYTFLPVGELPTAIVVPRSKEHAKYTYVANAGSRDITVLKTLAFRELNADQSAVQQTFQLPGGSLDVPYDMVLAPAEDALFVSMPQTGRLLRVAIQRCDDAPETCNDGELDPDGVTEIPLRDSVALSAMDQSPDVPTEEYAKVCGYRGGPISNASLPLPELPADAATTQPQPSGLAVDDFCEDGQPCTTRLFVADQALPLIHVVDFAAAASGGDAVEIPIRTGVPTTAVAVTPRVPADRSDNPAATQYVYAIDATDGSVLVTENGRLLQVGPEGTRPDRISLGADDAGSVHTVPVAVSLSVIWPAYNVNQGVNQYALPTRDQPATEGNYCTDTSHATRSNVRLRGVFLTVGTADGTIRVVDIHDMDLAHCRNCEKSQDYWDPYPLVRHRTRIYLTADPMMATPPLAPIAQPVFGTPGTALTVLTTGSTSDPVIDGLACVPCGEGQVPVFPSEEIAGALPDAGTPSTADAETPDGGAPTDETSDGGNPTRTDAAGCEALVCAQNDAWLDVPDWVAVYEGVIPGSRAGDVQLAESDGNYELQQTEARFCEHGVLGEDALMPTPGDRLNVVGVLPVDDLISKADPHVGENASERKRFESDVIAACKRLVSARDNTDTPEPIAFPIRAAYDDRLVLSPDLVTRPMGIPNGFKDDMEFVQKCFAGQPLTYELRAGSGWLVFSRNEGRFSHRVRAEEGTKHCVQDKSLGRTFNARANSNETFDNGSVTFKIADEGQPPRIGTSFAVGLVSTTPKVRLNATVIVNNSVLSVVPIDLRWSDQDDALYMVDVAGRGLVQILMDPFPIGGGTRAFR